MGEKKEITIGTTVYCVEGDYPKGKYIKIPKHLIDSPGVPEPAISLKTLSDKLDILINALKGEVPK